MGHGIESIRLAINLGGGFGLSITSALLQQLQLDKSPAQLQILFALAQARALGN